MPKNYTASLGKSDRSDNKLIRRGAYLAERCVHRPVEPDPGYTGVGNG
jgi:hypothetical protein